jgi:hypothetical protein
MWRTVRSTGDEREARKTNVVLSGMQPKADEDKQPHEAAAHACENGGSSPIQKQSDPP